jgi:hypothetical protein
MLGESSALEVESNDNIDDLKTLANISWSRPVASRKEYTYLEN